MEPTIKSGVQYTIADDKQITFSGPEFSALFGFFEGLVNNSQWQDSVFKVRDTINVINLRGLMTAKLQEAVQSGDAVEQVVK